MSKPVAEFTLTISNGSSQTHSAILLRKFFAMVFIQPGGKKLEIFIATVFGGIADHTIGRDGFPLPNYDKAENSTCYLNFEFQSKLLSKSGCKVEDNTESFCNQPEQIKRVWCNLEETGISEYIDEKTAAIELKNLYPELYKQGNPTLMLDPGMRPKVYKIEKGDAITHQCMAVWGSCRPSQGGEPKYTLSVPMKTDGLEAINWIKTELTLLEDILDRRIRFSVELAPGQTFYTPDFTWYFAPPSGSAVAEDTAMLTLGKDGKDVPNNIQNVRDDTTVLFKEWKDLYIEDRRKARAQPKLLDQWQSPFKALSDAGRITASFEIFNPEQKDNHQFMVGLVVAFVLSFCSDKTRINDFYECLKASCQCAVLGDCFCESLCNTVSILAPFVVLINFWSYAFAPKKCLPASWKEDNLGMWRCLHILRGIALSTFSALAVYIFGVWPVAGKEVGRFITCDWNRKIIYIAFSINMLCSVVHIVLMKLRYKRSPKY